MTNQEGGTKASINPNIGQGISLRGGPFTLLYSSIYFTYHVDFMFVLKIHSSKKTKLYLFTLSHLRQGILLPTCDHPVGRTE